MTQKNYKILKDTLIEDKENMISIKGEKYFIHQEKEGWVVDKVNDNKFETVKVYLEYGHIFTDTNYNGFSLDQLSNDIELEYF